MKSDVGFSLSLAEGTALDVVRFELTEGVSQAFRLELDLSSADGAIDAVALLDREATFTIDRDGLPQRTVAGICTAFEQCETGFRFTRYKAVIESPLARLGLRHNSRIFQQVNAPDILATILKEHRLEGAKTTYLVNHEPREYATQFREHDDSFVHRMATEEGIVYWHDAGHNSRLVLSDRIDTAPTLDGEVLYQPASAGDAPMPHLWHFAHRRQLAPTRATQRDATFHNPRYDLQHEAKPWAAERAIGDYEHYEFPGRYKADAAGKPFTRRAYNAANRPPYELPLHKTRTTFKTNTHKGKGYNELRFEDEAGQEEIFVHAQKDQNIVVENDETTKVGHDRCEDVGNDETIQIGHDRRETVGNDEALSVGQDRRETLGRDHQIDIGRSRQIVIGKDLIEDVRSVRIEKTASDRTVETGGHYEHKVAGRHDTEAGERIIYRTRVIELQASESLTFRGPGGAITLNDYGITIEAMQIHLKGPVKHDPDGASNALSILGKPIEGDTPDFSWVWRSTGG